MSSSGPRRVLVSGLKGGVGKTTVALNLAAHDTHQGKRVLVVELDPQANATSTVTGLYSNQIKRSIAEVLVDVSAGADPAEAVASTLLSAQDPALELTDYARRSWGQLEVLPATSAASGLALTPEHYRDLAKVLDAIEHQYDLILLDSAPGISLLTTLGAYAADSAISVAETTANSLAGVRQLITEMITPVQKHHDVQLIGVVANKVDVRLSEHRLRLDELREQLPDLFCRAWLPYRPAASQQAEGAGLPIRAMTGEGARVLTDLYSKLYRYLITETTR